MKNEIKYADLFGGVGGFRLGIERAISNRKQKSIRKGTEWKHSSSKGNIRNSDEWRKQSKSKEGCGILDGIHKAKCVFYSDIDKYAVQTYNKNFKENHKPTDIRTIKADSIPDIDMLCGGYPCQSFSIAGKRKGFDDTRGTLFFEIERIAKEKQPKIIFLENVKGLLSHDKGNTFKTITQHLNSMGYLVDYRILNSKYFGVPQNRERVFHIGYNIKWLIKENVEDGQIRKNSQLEKMLKGWLLENLLKDLEEVKKLPELKLKEWVLNYLRYICGNQTRLEYSKTIKNLQTSNYQNLSKEHQSQLLTKERNLDLDLREKGRNLKMVQDIYESMMEKETDYGFIELWQKSILGKLKKNNQSIISTLIKKIIEKKIFSCAEINLIMGSLIIQDSEYFQSWLSQELLDLIKLKEFIKNEGGRNKTKFRERYLLRNIRTSLGFTESLNEQRNFIIGSLREKSRPEILPFRFNNSEDVEENNLKQETKSWISTLDSRYGRRWSSETYVQPPQGTRIYNPKGISQTISSQGGGQGAKTGLYAMRGRNPNNPSDRVAGNPTEQRLELNKGRTTNTISTVQKDNLWVENTNIRRLTPIECERLQGFPDDWTEGVSDTQRYKQMGNAVTVNVIEAIVQQLIK